MSEIDDMAQALRRAERKLSAYVGVCRGDTELTNTILPMCRAALEAHDSRAQPASALHILFDGPPGPTAGRFVEVEDDAGKSVNAGEWKQREDGYWELVIARQAQPASVAGWVMVPRVPTEAMLAAIQDGGGNAYALPDHIDAEGAYEAMLAAAPQPQEKESK